MTTASRLCNVPVPGRQRARRSDPPLRVEGAPPPGLLGTGSRILTGRRSAAPPIAAAHPGVRGPGWVDLRPVAYGAGDALRTGAPPPLAGSDTVAGMGRARSRLIPTPISVITAAVLMAGLGRDLALQASPGPGQAAGPSSQGAAGGSAPSLAGSCGRPGGRASEPRRGCPEAEGLSCQPGGGPGDVPQRGYPRMYPPRDQREQLSGRSPWSRTGSGPYLIRAGAHTPAK